MKNKKIAISLIILFVSMAISATVFAMDPNEINYVSSVGTDTGIWSIVKKVFRIVRYIGTIGATIAIVILGIKYMLGSAEEKAEYKKTLMPYVIGAIIVFGFAGIVRMIEAIGDGIFA